MCCESTHIGIIDERPPTKGSRDNPPIFASNCALFYQSMGGKAFHARDNRLFKELNNQSQHRINASNPSAYN
jgi:hypothetical protein